MSETEKQLQLSLVMNRALAQRPGAIKGETVNLLEHYVIEVLGPPERREWDDGAVTCWLVPARVDCYGQVEDMKVFCRTAEEAEQVKVGYVYLA